MCWRIWAMFELLSTGQWYWIGRIGAPLHYSLSIIKIEGDVIFCPIKLDFRSTSIVLHTKLKSSEFWGGYIFRVPPKTQTLLIYSALKAQNQAEPRIFLRERFSFPTGTQNSNAIDNRHRISSQLLHHWFTHSGYFYIIVGCFCIFFASS